MLTAQTKTTAHSALRQSPPSTPAAAETRGALSAAHEELLRIQTTAGNQAVNRVIQAKLKVSTPGDRYEREADRVANQVTRMTHPGAMSVSQFAMDDNTSHSHLSLGGTPNQRVQRTCSHCEDAVQRKPLCDDCGSEVQRSAQIGKIQTSANSQGDHAASSNLNAHIDSARGGGQPLSTGERAFFESRFNHDFSGVRIHTGHSAAQAAETVKARAFTVGQDIVFGNGEYAPHSDVGNRLIAHELAHTIQQSSAQATSSALPISNSGDSSEVQADSAAEAALAKPTPYAPGPQFNQPQLLPVPLHVATKADPAAVAKKKPAEVMQDPDYIDNNLTRMEFFSAEQVRLHYKDGAQLLIGLVPRWIQPPLETVDYHSEKSDLVPVINPSNTVDSGNELKFVPNARNLPAKGMTYAEVLKKFTKTVNFSVDASSGKIIPNHLNALTAPFLCTWLLKSEEEYVRNIKEVSAGAIKILNVMKLVVELQLLRVSIGGPKTPTPKPAPGAAPAGGALLSRAGTVTVESAIEQGLVKGGGKLAQVLRAIQARFLARAPASASEGLGLIQEATASVGLEAGVASVEGSTIVLANFGGVTTRILASGEIVITRGTDILLRLLP